ncbi:hypothetical protein NHH73_25060 [Oxalobacteraceae bacterium OTU3CINTB1]|nr:hypothetical protein NHH73_25060 [Oxalobacteraceae bacterium OTU3CINTB1]
MSILSTSSTSSATAAATTTPLTYEQLIADANDHPARAKFYAEMVGMEVRPNSANSANLDLFQGHELIFDDKPAEEVHTYLWGYVNGSDDAKLDATNKALLITADSKDGAANLMSALTIADGYGWTIQIASYGLVVRNGKFTKDFPGLADFFIFADGYGAAIDDHCKVYASIEELEANETPSVAPEAAIG